MLRTKRDLQEWTKNTSDCTLIKQGKDKFIFYPIVGDKQRITGSATTQCDSVLQFIAETNSQYNLAPAKLTSPMIPTFCSTTHLTMVHMHTDAASNDPNYKAPPRTLMSSTISLNDPRTQIWVREASKFQIRNNRWMCQQKADPLVSGTVRKLVNKGIHLVCVFFHTLRVGPVTVVRS